MRPRLVWNGLAAVTWNVRGNTRVNSPVRSLVVTRTYWRDSDVDAVYISTPPVLHQEWIVKAAEAGKHVLCEKPAFGTFESAQVTVEQCRSRGVRLMEGYAFKFHPQHAAVHSLIEQGRIGHPRFFSAECAYPRPPENDIRLKPELGGGVFCDSAGYPVAAALLQASSRPLSVFCQLGYDREAGV